MSTTGVSFTNWVGNQTCTVRRRVSPGSEAEVQEVVREAAERGEGVRVVATGHSFTPVHLSEGTLIDLAAFDGIASIDAAARRVRSQPGTSIAGFGDPLWDAGLALPNQGDIDTQCITGAIGTGTHGSGIGLTSFSGTLRGCRVVTGTGDVVAIDERTPDLLAAAQVAVGTLGVMTEVEIEVAPAYRLAERIEHWSFDEMIEQFDERVASHRHFSMFWCPTERSPGLYGLEMEPGKPSADNCYVKLYDEAPDDLPDSDEPRRRVGRSYRIYPAVFEPNFHELEYFVRFDRAKEALAAMRELMLASQPDAVFPLEVRTVGEDGGYLSSQYGTPTLVLSVSGEPGTDYWPYLRAVDRLLGEGFDARVHWGKLHFLTRDQLMRRYPRAQDFIDIRRRLDPAGIFLNDHLRPLLA